MGLPWVRLDSGWPTNTKTLALVADRHYQAAAAYTFALAWCGHQGTDGYVPLSALPVIHATRKVAEQLVDVGLFDLAQGGWQIHDWATYQVSSEEHQKRSARARELAMRRWKPEAMEG